MLNTSTNYAPVEIAATAFVKGRNLNMEMQDIYDAHGSLLGKTCARYAKKPQGEYNKVVHVFLMDDQGNVLIQQRSFEKFIWPGEWALLGGYVRAGETSRQTVVREVAEELGVDVSAAPIEKVFEILRPEYGTIMEYWLVRANIETASCVLQEEEVVAIKYVTTQELYAIYAHSKRWNDKDTPHIQPMLDLFLRLPELWQTVG